MSPKEYRPQGLYFEEFDVGDIMISPGRTVTESDIATFCGLAGDYNEVHSNVEYAKSTMFGKPIAPGMLGLSMASGLATRLALLEGTVQAFMGMDWRFKKPIFAGDTLHVRSVVAQKREIKALKGGVLILDVTVNNQSDETVQEGKWTVLMKSRPE
jgi:acyl dehydratase